MSIGHGCARPPLFPAAIFNRPALTRIGYRIGDYTLYREHLLARLDQALELSAWTHRGADDPGIALLECAAITGEILTFYQELYANEAYLRTAQWRESVARLVALTGFRLAPGLGGAATFALGVDGNGPVTVPAGFGFKAELDGADEPALFEGLDESTAYPWLSSFRLYRPRLAPGGIAAAGTALELRAVDDEAGLAERQAVDLSPGDRLLLVPDAGIWEAGGGAYTDPQALHEILVLKEVETVLDRIILHFEGGLALGRDTRVLAYRIDRSFRHFGHSAPVRIGAFNELTGIMSFTGTPFKRPLDLNLRPDLEALDFSSLAPEEMPLDQEVDNLAAGGKLIITGELLFSSVTDPTPMTLVREIAGLHKDTLTWGGLSGGSTVVRLTDPLVTNDEITDESLDIRRVELHEVTGPALSLEAPSDWQDGDFGTGAELGFFGTHAQALDLAGRELLLQDDEGVLQSLFVDSSPEDLDLLGRDQTNPWIWTLRLNQPPRFQREAFDEIDNRVTVYGNLVRADQGETQDRVAIGNGDAREVFQTFRLPKAPLTYLLRNEHSPPQVPELEIHVDDVLWQRVETFFDSGPTDRVYIVRQDDEGNSLVQFGDGKTGARLGSGRRNVTAGCRVGSGAYGPLQPDKPPKAVGRLQPLTDVWMPSPATLGAEPEEADAGREAAPARMQALGRLVGLADYEAEALSLPGVLKARAAWAAPAGVPRLRLVVLTDGGSEEEARAIADAMTAANSCRGASRFPIETLQGTRRYLHLDLTLGYAADRISEDVSQAVKEALGLQETDKEPEQGLFGYKQRGFGQGAHVSRVIGAVQQVPGVVWVLVDAFQVIPPGMPPETDPAELGVPENPVRNEAVDCPGDALLALYETHLYLSLTREPTAEECV